MVREADSYIGEPKRGPNSFDFTQFSGKCGKIDTPGEFALPPGGNPGSTTAEK